MWLPLTCPLLGTRPATQACDLIGNQTGDPLTHRPVLNPLSHTRQVCEDSLSNSIIFFSLIVLLDVDFQTTESVFGKRIMNGNSDLKYFILFFVY